MDFDLTDDPRLAALWPAVTAAIGDMPTVVDGDPRVNTPLLRAEGMRYLMRLLWGGLQVTGDGWDFEHPWLIKFVTPFIQYGIPATDCLYMVAAVHGDGVYRITGNRGSAHLFDVEARQGHMAHLGDWTLIDRKAWFETSDDGSIEIVLAREKQPGNWVRIGEGPGHVLVRQYFYDWDNEQTADLIIEKDGAIYPPPPLTPALSADRLELLVAWCRKVLAACRFSVDEYHEVPQGTLKFVEIDYAWADLVYGKGMYTCAADEAVIMELTPPDAEYWQIQLTSQYWEALDWPYRQTSLNGHQATLDDDGVFRGVICHSDPGVANWYDAGGHATGLITARYYKAASRPVPTLKTVPLASVSAHLPASTKRVSPQERQAVLQARARSIWRRRMH
jgi:hypothetical protein